MTAFTHHFAFEFRSGLRNASLLMMNYLFPLGLFGLFGLLMTKVNPTFGQNMIPAMITIAAMTSCVLGLPNPLVELRESGVYRSYKINGVPAPSILGIPTLTTVIHLLIVAAIITVAAPAAFGAGKPLQVGTFVLITLAVAFVYGSLGALIGVIATNTRATMLMSQLIFLPSMILGGLMMPASAVPDSLRIVAGLLPTTYAIEAYKGLAFGQPTVIEPAIALAILLASGVLAFGLAVYLFNWDSHNNARRGHPALAILVLLPYILGIILS
jgi:ABC-2 type transport system permease protein